MSSVSETPPSAVLPSAGPSSDIPPTAVRPIAVAPEEARGRFLGSKQEYWRLLSRDAMQLIATLGLYRFWVATDIRQYLWSRTEIDGEPLEYTGDPLELLVGFLILIVILAPLVSAMSLITLATGNIAIAVLASYLPVVLLVPAGVLALYQARRYRVNQTIFRGLRFHQTGSAWVYALRTVLWFAVNVATFGLSYPWARASLERYKMRHTFYGDGQGGFTGSGWTLFKRGLLLWIIVLGGPVVFVFILGSQAATASQAEMNELSKGFAIIIAAWLVVTSLLVYPVLHARVLRWRFNGMTFGALALKTEISAWTLYKGYLKFFGMMLVLGVIVIGVAVFVQSSVVPALPLGRSMVIESIGVICLVVAYFAVATTAAFAYQGTVRFDTWRAIASNLVLTGTGQLDAARARPDFAPRHSGRIGGALKLGGF